MPTMKGLWELSQHLIETEGETLRQLECDPEYPEYDAYLEFLTERLGAGHGEPTQGDLEPEREPMEE